MAQRVIVELSSDLSDGPADQTVTFALEGKGYEIDLNSKEAEKLRSLLEPYIKAGRSVGRATGGAVRRTARSKDGLNAQGVSPVAVRAWAAAQQPPVKVAPQGRIPASVIDAYKAAGN